MSDMQTAPQTAQELRTVILERYDSLSSRLQQIARYVLDEPNELALETLAVIADRSGVQPSAIVRFAKSFGFDGASQMQRLFRDGLLSGHTGLGYTERARSFSRAVDRSGAAGGADLLGELIGGNTNALQNLNQTVKESDIAAAVKVIMAADVVYVVGFRRAFPVASYLAYSLQQAGERTIFVDGVAGLARQQIQTITPNDLLIGISYHPYAEETVQAVETAASRGAKILSISDSLVSPIAKPANVTLQIRESEIRGFRSLSASMCLAQTLLIAVAFEVSRKQDAKNRRSKG